MRNRGEVLYQPEFKAVAGVGDFVMVRAGGGSLVTDDGGPLYEVTDVEPMDLLNTHGVIGIWCATTKPAAPYKMDANATTAHSAVNITAGSPSAQLNMAFTDNRKRQLIQWRPLIVAIPDSNSAALTGALEDYDVIWTAPGTNPAGGTVNQSGVWNALSQVTLPSSGATTGGTVQPMPAQGSNYNGTTSAMFTGPFESVYRRQQFTYGPSNSGSNGKISVQNNGSGTANTGGIGLIVAGFRYSLRAVPEGSRGRSVWLYGKERRLNGDVNPEHILVVPCGTFNEPI